MSSITAKTVQMVKQVDGSVNIYICDALGTVRAMANISSADFTSFNTTVNGGSTGASLSKTYAQIPHGSITPVGIYEKD